LMNISSISDLHQIMALWLIFERWPLQKNKLQINHSRLLFSKSIF